jgi:hypothetical protein
MEGLNLISSDVILESGLAIIYHGHIATHYDLFEHKTTLLSPSQST